MKIVSMILLLFVTLSFAGLAEEQGPDCFTHFSDTTFVYQYDSYEGGAWELITVEELSATHKFYLTDTSIVYAQIINGVETEIEREFNNGNKKTLKKLLKLFKRIDDGKRVKVVFSEWKFVGFDVNGVLYSMVEIDKATSITLTTPATDRRIELSIPTQNTYKIFNLQGRVIGNGVNITNVSTLDLSQYGRGVFFVHVTGYNPNFSHNFMTIR